MERSRLNYEVTNQQLMAVISKLSTQLSRAKISNNSPQQRKQTCDTPTSLRKQVNNTIKESSTARASLSSASTSSSFRRQKAIRWESSFKEKQNIYLALSCYRIKKRDSVRRNPSVLSQGKVDSQSYTSSDSGNYSDNNTDPDRPMRGQKSDQSANQRPEGPVNDKDNENKEQLGKLLRKGLTLVGNVKQELDKVTSRSDDTKTVGRIRSQDTRLSSHSLSARETIGMTHRMSSKISTSAGKVVIKIQTDETIDGPSKTEKPTSITRPSCNNENRSDSIVEIKTDKSGTVLVPVPYTKSYYNV